MLLQARQAEFLKNVEASTGRLVGDSLSKPRSVEKLLDAIVCAQAFASEGIAGIEQVAEGKGIRIACQKGCGFCCHIRVAALVPEVLSIAHTIRRDWSDEMIEALKGRLAGHRAARTLLRGAQRFSSPIACPLLVDSACSVHAVRPLACRSHHSLDVRLCERAMPDTDQVKLPQLIEIPALVGSVAKGVELGLRQRGLKADRVQLVDALLIALEDPTAGERWVMGEDSFKQAVDSEFNLLAERNRLRVAK